MVRDLAGARLPAQLKLEIQYALQRRRDERTVKVQPFVVTLCGLLIYRGAARYYTEDATAGFGFGASFPTLEWLTAGRTDVMGFPLPHSVVAPEPDILRHDAKRAWRSGPRKAFEQVTARETFEQMIANEKIPNFLR